MIETGVRIFWVSSTVLLSLTYAIAWGRFSIVEKLGNLWPAMSPIDLHYTTAIPLTLLQFLAALGVLFYFIGTGVWIKEQAFAAAPSNKAKAEKLYNVFRQANKLKGHTFPFMTFSIFFGIMTFVLGGARQVEAIPFWLHPLVGSAFLLVSVISIPFVLRAVKKNIDYLDQASEIVESR